MFSLIEIESSCLWIGYLRTDSFLDDSAFCTNGRHRAIYRSDRFWFLTCSKFNIEIYQMKARTTKTIVKSNTYICTYTAQLLIDCETHSERERERERENERALGLARNIVQLSRRTHTHTYDRIIFFIAIFARERKGNDKKNKRREEKRKKRRGVSPSWSFSFSPTGFNAAVGVCHNHIDESFFYNSNIQSWRREEKKKKNRMTKGRSEERGSARKKRAKEEFSKERVRLRMRL